MTSTHTQPRQRVHVSVHVSRANGYDEPRIETHRNIPRTIASVEIVEGLTVQSDEVDVLYSIAFAFKAAADSITDSR